VYLVGAGPGDPELLTLKANRLLKSADVILYDRLVNEQILNIAKSDCQKIFVGKKLGLDQDKKQQQIISQMVNFSKKGAEVVRLKGGDPFLFGRGAEEAEALKVNNIPFDIVPGISSALAGPAYAGIPITHRDCASSVAIVTGHGAASKQSIPVNFSLLSRCADTLVIWMGMKNLSLKNLSLIVSEIRTTLPSDTPVALVQNATTDKQRVLTATLDTVALEAKNLEFVPPVVMIVGNVVKYHEILKWVPQKVSSQNTVSTMMNTNV